MIGAARTEVDLREWETASPERGSPLEGKSFEGDPSGRTLAEVLTAEGRIQVSELVKGLEIRTTSFVGKVRLGQIQLTIRPKLSGIPLLNLLQYAYGLRHLNLHGRSAFSTVSGGFQELLIHQLAGEAEELISRGLHRDYISLADNLSSPRGRIDFGKYLGTYVHAQTSLPCTHHPRSEDNLLNQVLLAGLLLSTRLTSSRELRFKTLRLCKRLADSVSQTELNRYVMRNVWAAIDRRTKNYESAMTLIDLLIESVGASFSSKEDLELSGFLFDMNRFFQALLSRFLSEHLLGFEVEDERRLKSAFAFDSHKNPLQKRPPTPRPDFVILREKKIVAILDAKYRDLWDRSLPESMLYQLSIYALCHETPHRSATILYPTLDLSAQEQSIVVNDAVRGSARARVHLRPVNLLSLEKMLSNRSDPAVRHKCREFAHRLAFGTDPD